MATTTLSTFITVSTTRPVVEDTLKSLCTDRLIIRPLLMSDLPAFRVVRTQPAAMTSSGKGRPDGDILETEDKLRRLQSPYSDSHVYYGIFLKKPDNTEGELIGDGGVHKFTDTETGWPEFGYKLKKEHWNHGFATEFAKKFLKEWWDLPRKDLQIQVVPCSFADYEGRSGVTEQVCAWTKVGNVQSERVLDKVGFERIEGMKDDKFHYWRLTRDFFEKNQ